ncbi:alpha/beta hydrolase [Pseudomonas sp. NW5]|uniref:alpha/beta hydrolase n=1 Tax=Pseudomonas sp. NW5 TaxID=2934934 RepID=UPI002020EABE|nr:alpha/beta hydrolase [Pseudomonas sp. NW5]MCL7461304.1 alpha/beta hydrolase [Pseudomonas sp. NW5]
MSAVFQPALLRAHLPAFFEGQAPASRAFSAQYAAYRQLYGLPPVDGLQSRLGWVSAGGRRLALQGWWRASARATLLVLHGYYDHMGLYRHVIDWALAQDLAVLACDLPGHGLSEGAPASIEDFAEYQQALKALLASAQQLGLPEPWHMLGQSTGGAILLDYLLHKAPRPALGQRILLAPLVRPQDWRRARLTYHLLRPFVQQIPRRYSENSADRAFLDFVQRDPLQARILPTAWVGALARWIGRIEAARPTDQPLLILQGDADRTVDWRHNLGVLSEKFPAAETLLLPGARHHLVNEAPEQRQRLFELLAARLG